MAKEPKFNLTPESEINKKSKYSGSEYRVSLIVSSMLQKGKTERTPTYALHFPHDVIYVYDLQNKKVKFYCDREKKCIFWRIMDEMTPLEKFNDARLVKASKSGVWVVSVQKMINAMELDIKQSRLKIPVKKYSSPGYLDGADFWYINLSKETND